MLVSLPVPSPLFLSIFFLFAALFAEATSALDSESEAVVQAAIDALLHEAKKAAAAESDAASSTSAAAKRTILLIAHRLSTIRHADVIFVVDKGVVHEKGSHEALVAAGGLYAKMVAAQDAGLGVGGAGGGRRRSSVSAEAAKAAAAT